MCSNNVASAHVILKKMDQIFRVAVSQEEKWYPTILRVICLYSIDKTEPPASYSDLEKLNHIFR